MPILRDLAGAVLTPAAVFAAFFATGYWLYGEAAAALAAALVGLVSGGALARV